MSDFKQKEPSKNEKLIYELFMQQQQMEKGLWSTSTLAIASAILNNVSPEKLAELMVNGDEQIKDYSKKVNEAIRKLEEAKHKDHKHDHESSASAEASADKHDHSHGEEAAAPAEEAPKAE